MATFESVPKYGQNGASTTVQSKSITTYTRTATGVNITMDIYFHRLTYYAPGTVSWAYFRFYDNGTLVKTVEAEVKVYDTTWVKFASYTFTKTCGVFENPTINLDYSTERKDVVNGTQNVNTSLGTSASDGKTIFSPGAYATKVTAPSNIKATYTYGESTSSIAVSFTKGSAGTNNAISKYRIYYKYSGVPTTSSYDGYKDTTTTSGTVSFTTGNKQIYLVVGTVGKQGDIATAKYNSGKAITLFTDRTAPTIKTLTNNAGTTSGTVAVTFTAGTGGTNNAIKNTIIYYRWGSAPTTSSYAGKLTVAAGTLTTSIPYTDTESSNASKKLYVGGVTQAAHNTSAMSATKEISVTDLITNVTAPTFTLVDNKDGTVTISTTKGTNGRSNVITSTKVFYKFNNSTVTTSSYSGTYSFTTDTDSRTIDYTGDNSSIYVIAQSVAPYNSPTSSVKGINLTDIAPERNIAPTIALTVEDYTSNVSVEWNGASAGSNNIIAGYQLQYTLANTIESNLWQNLTYVSSDATSGNAQFSFDETFRYCGIRCKTASGISGEYDSEWSKPCFISLKTPLKTTYILTDGEWVHYIPYFALNGQWIECLIDVAGTTEALMSNDSALIYDEDGNIIFTLEDGLNKLVIAPALLANGKELLDINENVIYTLKQETVEENI